MADFVYFDEFYECASIIKGGENMAIRDYWLYQKRDVPTPWAIYFVKEYDKRDVSATCIDFTLYHEDIPTQLHSKSYVCLKHDTPEEYAVDIVEKMSEYVSVTDSDRAQIVQELRRILA